jgi:hypothetical protein
MEFYSAIKKSEIMLFAGKWMELKNFMLSKVSQAQKVKGFIFFLICERYKLKVYVNTCMIIYIYTYIIIYIMREQDCISGLSEGTMGGGRGKENVRE